MEDGMVNLSNPDSDQVAILDKLIGKKIQDIEIIEDGPEAIVKIIFDDEGLNYIEFYAQYMKMIYVYPKPKKLH
jgi:hypothetical protein